MSRPIRFDVQSAAERMLEGPLNRRRWGAELRDALADEIEKAIVEAFRNEGVKVYFRIDET